MQRFRWIGPLFIIYALLGTSVWAAPKLPDVPVVNEFAVDGMLSQYLDGETLLVMGFYHCKHMCNYVVRDLGRDLGRFEKHPKVVFFGIDEKEGPRDAIHLKRRIVGPNKNRWTFLVAEKAAIDQLAKSLNFEMSRDPVTEVITHEMGIYWVKDSVVLKKIDVLELKESDLSDKSILHQSVDAIKRFCTAFDPTRSKYGAEVLQLLSVSALLFVILGGIGWWKIRRRRDV